MQFDMKVLVVVPAVATTSRATAAWRARLSAQDQLFILECSGFGVRQVSGCQIHTLDHEIAISPRWRALLVPLFSRWQGLERLFWRTGIFLLLLPQIWPSLLFNLRSFDSDVIDVSSMPGSRRLERMLSEYRQIVILSRGGSAPIETAEASWRRYDPTVKVSIVLPVYNGARYLRESIESCLQQTHRNIELVIVDDGSTDETPNIIAEFARRDPRIISLRNERNLRLPAALNRGFARTTGELLTWTSCDNYYAHNAVEALVRYLCTWRDVDFVYSASRRVDENGQIGPYVRYRLPPWVLPHFSPVGPYFLYRRVVYQKIGEFRTDMEYAEDYEYWVRVFKRFRMMRLHLPLYYYRRHSNSMTARAKALDLGRKLRERVRREHFSRSKSRAGGPRGGI